MSEAVTVYTVLRTPVTAAAKRSAGYDSREFEFIANSAAEARQAAISGCEWRDATSHFVFQTVASRVLLLTSGSNDL